MKSSACCVVVWVFVKVKRVSDIGMITGRCPVRPVVIGTFANEVIDVKED